MSIDIAEDRADRAQPTASRGMVELDDVVRVFGRGEGEVRALDGVTLSLARGTFTAIMGPSGSGQVDAAADRGRARPADRAAAWSSATTSSAISARRRSPACAASSIGFVFQSFNLLGALTAEQNVALPARLAGKRLPRAVVRDALEQRRPRRPRAPPARAAVGRPAAARRDRARARRPAGRHLRRRADRRPGHPLGPRRPRAAPPTRSTRADARWSWSRTTRRPPRGPTASSSWPTGASRASSSRRPPSRSPSA